MLCRREDNLDIKVEASGYLKQMTDGDKDADEEVFFSNHSATLISDTMTYMYCKPENFCVMNLDALVLR